MKFSASISVQYDNVFSPFPGKEWERGFEWVKSCGFDGVELILSDPNLLDTPRILRKLDILDLKVSTISTGQAAILEGLGMTDISADIRGLTRKRLYDDIDFSAELGRPNVTIGLIRGKGNAENKEAEFQLLKRELAALAEYATKKGVLLNLEPINRYECALIHSVEDANRIVTQTLHQNIFDSMGL